VAPEVISADYPTLALLTGASAALIWAAVMLRSLVVWWKGRRMCFDLLMPVTAFIAALGMLASATGSALTRGAIDLEISRDALSLVASMGRGALLMAGLIVITQRPRRP
jgi:hypothetical protein